MKKIFLGLLLISNFAFAQQQTVDAADPLNTGRTKINSNFTELYTNSLQKGTSLIWPANTVYVAPPISVLGNGQEDLEFLNFGNPLANTEDRNLVSAGIYRHTGSLIMSRNVKWNDTFNRWEYHLSTASAYNPSWIEAGGEGMNLGSTPVATHPYQHPAGFGFSVRGNGLRSTTSALTYVNQTNAPMYGVYESAASGLAEWTDTGGTQPIFGALALEAKGSGGALGNFYEAESHGASYGGFRFLSSNGTKTTPTTSSSNKIVGAIYSTPYAAAYNRTAEMQFITRGSIGSNDVGQSVLFRTSPDATANLADRFEITDDGQLKAVNAPYIYKNTAISTVPIYSSFSGFTVANEASELLRIQHLSTSTGGVALYGMSTTSTASTAIALGFIGALGATSPTAPAIIFSARKNNGSNTLTDIAATEKAAEFRNNATVLSTLQGSGRWGFGAITTPTATLHLPAGTTTASSGPIKFTEGSNPTSAEDGLINYVSNNVTFTETSTVYTLAKTLTATATLDFPSVASLGVQTLTITVTGAADGDIANYSVPNGSMTAGLVFNAWVSAANTVSIQCYNSTLGAIDPASGTFRASIIKY